MRWNPQAQRARLSREQHAIGRQREVANPRQGGEQPDEFRKIAAEERFTSG